MFTTSTNSKANQIHIMLDNYINHPNKIQTRTLHPNTSISLVSITLRGYDHGGVPRGYFDLSQFGHLSVPAGTLAPHSHSNATLSAIIGTEISTWFIDSGLSLRIGWWEWRITGLSKVEMIIDRYWRPTFKDDGCRPGMLLLYYLDDSEFFSLRNKPFAS